MAEKDVTNHYERDEAGEWFIVDGKGNKTKVDEVRTIHLEYGYWYGRTEGWTSGVKAIKEQMQLVMDNFFTPAHVESEVFPVPKGSSAEKRIKIQRGEKHG